MVASPGKFQLMVKGVALRGSGVWSVEGSGGSVSMLSLGLGKLPGSLLGPGEGQVSR
jgi:hypothetical protein